MSSRLFAASLLTAFTIAGFPGAATADNNGDHGNDLKARPFVFVGTAAQCGGVAGSRIVTSGWLGGMGLPDDGTSLNSPNPSSRQDPHLGLLLNKNGPTSDCSASGASIEGFKSGTPITELGFDFRVGGHCGAGAPRFNVTTTAGFLYFVGGCANGTQTPAPQDPEWMRVRFGQGQVFPQLPSNPPFVIGTTPVRSIEIIFDEGTDSSSASDPTGVGLAVIDNIDINGKLITAGRGIVPKNDGNANGRENADDD